MKEAISQEMMADSSHSCIPEENETTQSGSSFKSAAMLGIALSVGASGVIVSQSEAAAAVSAPATKAEAHSQQEKTVAEPVQAEGAATQEIIAYHTVETGQSLWQIAQQHRVGLRELKEANALPPETSIRVGQVLKVPANSQVVETPKTASSALIASLTASEGTLAEAQQGAAVEIALLNGPGEETDNAGVDKAAEPSITLENETPAPAISIEIADASQGNSQSPETASVSQADPVVTALAVPSNLSHYQVRSGDTLHKIASSLGTTSEELMRANSLANPNVILAGDTLRIPASATGYVPAQTAPAGTALNGAARISTERANERTESNALAYLQQTASRSEETSLIGELRDASPQEPMSVGGEEVTQADLLSSRPEESETTNPYVANLLEEVREIRERSVQVSEVEADIDERVIAQDNRVDSDSASLLARRRNSAEPANISERLARTEGDTQTQAVDSELLAAAPLSPDAYIPAQRPSAGQVVSPDMPMLPNADEYLPEAPDYFDGYVWPARGTLTSGYGWRWGRMHHGVDVAGPVGTPIVAAGSGVVEQAGWNSGGYGNLVEIRHPDGSLTRYAHNNRLNVSAGQTVRQGQQIAEMGSTGYSTGPHLHFEIHKSGSGSVNPMAYLPNR